MNRFRDSLVKYKIEFAVLAVFLVLIGVFVIANPKVFLNYQAYLAVFTTLGASIILVTSSVFVVASGELDLSFPSIIGLSAMVFALIVKAGASPILALFAALLTGAFCGFLNGMLVTQVGLSSLVSTLGMNFLLRGLIMILTGGLAIALTELRGTPFWNLFAGRIGEFPVQLLWGLGFAFLGWLLFARHKFGGHVCYVGDNLTSAKEMGIRVDRVKTWTFMLMGFSAGFTGVLVTLLNSTFWPTTGQTEAALSLGMSRRLTLRRIVLPQALRVALPGIANDFIALLKDSSLVSVITVVELTKQMTITAVDVRSWVWPGLLCALLYLALSYPLSRLARRLESRLVPVPA